jgi:hypothetical protein
MAPGRHVLKWDGLSGTIGVAAMQSNRERLGVTSDDSDRTGTYIAAIVGAVLWALAFWVLSSSLP